MRLCRACGASLEGDARKRYCDDKCRQRGHRGATVTEITPDPVDESVAGSTRRTLEAAGRLDTPAGTAAMVIAGKLDRGGDTGSAVAALVRELRASVAEALSEAEVPDDPVDDLTRKREERRARAGA